MTAQRCQSCQRPTPLADLAPVDGWLLCASCRHDAALLERARADLDADRRLAQVVTEYVAARDAIDTEPADDWQAEGERTAEVLGTALLAAVVTLATLAALTAVAWVMGWVE